MRVIGIGLNQSGLGRLLQGAKWRISGLKWNGKYQFWENYNKKGHAKKRKEKECKLQNTEMSHTHCSSHKLHTPSRAVWPCLQQATTVPSFWQRARSGSGWVRRCSSSSSLITAAFLLRLNARALAFLMATFLSSAVAGPQRLCFQCRGSISKALLQ